MDLNYHGSLIIIERHIPKEKSSTLLDLWTSLV